tara:strand:+ start:753 stop:1214 length:462 start_codon:yes stop_codon:yes gene_type:complete
MKLIPLALLLLASPAYAGGPRVPYRSTGDYSNHRAYSDYKSNRGYASENKCYRKEYREEYIPGNSSSPGYVVRYKEKVEIPCGRRNYYYNDPPIKQPKKDADVDDNSCVEGSILGGIGGAGLGAALSRGDGRLWAIPLGIVGGAVAGCQIDGG